MKIALIGATGFVGSQVLREASERGHDVTAIARRIGNVPRSQGVTAMKADIADAGRLAEVLRGHDVVVSATKFLRTDPRALGATIAAAGVPRWMIVGGAGSLEVTPGVALVDTPEFPAEYRSEALAGRAFLEVLRGLKEPLWTFLSPPALLEPGPRTGNYRVGGDRLLADEAGHSGISVADYAVALVDELENPRHPGQRFTVASSVR